MPRFAKVAHVQAAAAPCPVCQYDSHFGALLTLTPADALLAAAFAAPAATWLCYPGIIGALDPYTHKVNTASLSGEGKLELEGVRPLRTNTAAVANIAASIMAGELF